MVDATMDQRFQKPISPLRDIRPDLLDRLREAAARQEEHARKANEATADVDMLQRMIEREDERLKESDAKRPVPSEDLPDYLLKSLYIRPMSKDELRQAAIAAGYNIDGRSIHAVTVNLVRSGKIVEVDNGVFTADMDLVSHARAGG